MSQAQPPLAIFVSPHFDDIALSCAGMAARLSKMGARCIALTIFTAPSPTGDLSPYARYLHGQWENAHGSSEQPINEVRREEERQAMRLLGLEYRWLDLPDAPYRRGEGGQTFYNSDEQLLGTLAPEERRSLVPLVAEQIRQVAGEAGARGRVRVFAPLGVGHHVDHQVAFWAARRLGPRFGVLYYEDFPYVMRPGALDARLKEIGLPARPRITGVGDLIGIKIAAIARYRSQLAVLFGSGEAMPAAVRDHAQISGEPAGLQLAERFWLLPTVYTLA